MTGTSAALVVIDVQKGFDDLVWGPRNNPAAEDNIAALLARCARRRETDGRRRPRLDRARLPAPPNRPGNELAALLDGFEPDLVFGKTVNSAFHGEVDLHGWLADRGIGAVVLAGIQTNMCVETTARVGWQPRSRRHRGHRRHLHVRSRRSRRSGAHRRRAQRGDRDEPARRRLREDPNHPGHPGRSLTRRGETKQRPPAISGRGEARSTAGSGARGEMPVLSCWGACRGWRPSCGARASCVRSCP